MAAVSVDRKSSRLKNIKLSVAYDGSQYHGFQFQLNAVTVQQVLEEKLSSLLGEPIRVTGAGRTDAGVHAYKQVVNFRTISPIPTDRIPIAARGVLPRDIVVTHACEVPADFNARFSATGKLYCYRILNTPVIDPTQRNYSWQICSTLDVVAMDRALQILVGEHDFSAFQSAGSSAGNPFRTLYSLDCVQRHGLIEIRLHGNGFLYHMVRNIIGTIVEVGSGKITLEQFETVFLGRDRRRAGAIAPAAGLYLVEVYYKKAANSP